MILSTTHSHSGNPEFPAEIPHFLAFVGIIFIKGPDDEIWDFSNQENGLQK